MALFFNKIRPFGGLVFLAYCVLGFQPPQALAGGDEVRSLTQDNVRAFIEETSHLTKGADDFLSTQKIRRYLEKHLDDEARFTSTITYHIPGTQPQSIEVRLDKADFMDTVGEGTKSIQGYENRVEITEVKISWGSKQAFVKTQNFESGFMPVPKENGGASEDVPIEGVSNCAQVIALNDGVIQMVNAVCQTDIQFLEN